MILPFAERAQADNSKFLGYCLNTDHPYVTYLKNKVMDELHLHDLVALTVPLPDYKLRRGEIGVIVDTGPRGDYLLEFVSKDGTPYATPTVPASQLMKVYLQASMIE